MNARGRTQFAPTEKDREHKNSLSFFHTPCPARYSVLHRLGVLSGGNEPPLCKGRWLAQARRRDCKKLNFIVKQSLSHLRRQLPLHKGAFGLCAPKVRHLFLTSTAFVDTKAIFYFNFSFIFAISSLNPLRKPYQLSFTL